MDIMNNLMFGLISSLCLLTQGHSSPAHTLESVLTKLDLISNEHEHMMSVLQKLTGSKLDKKDESQDQCDGSGKLTTEISDTLKYIKDKLDIPGAREMIEGSGATYVRWGRTECPDNNGTVKVYDGFAGGDYYQHSGGPSELLCLPKEPQWAKYDDDYLGHAFVYGVEFEPGSVAQSMKLFGKNINQENVPCVVCQSVGRLAALRIPARTDCFDGWTKEYDGYLMGGYHGHAKATDYTCVDSNPEVVIGKSRDQGGQLLYFVEAHCHSNSLPCPPYVHGREIPCVVCTK